MARISGKTIVPHQLIAAGRELFSLHGYNATGIQQITDLAGVPKGSFYNHFDSKEAFAAVIIDQYAEQLRQTWTQMMQAAPREPLAAVAFAFSQMISHYEHAASWKGCLVGNFAAEMAESSDLCRQRLAVAMEGWHKGLARLIRDAQAQGEVRQDIDASKLSALTWDVWEGALLRMSVERSVAPLRESMDLMLNHLLRPA